MRVLLLLAGIASAASGGLTYECESETVVVGLAQEDLGASEIKDTMTRTTMYADSVVDGKSKCTVYHRALIPNGIKVFCKAGSREDVYIFAEDGVWNYPRYYELASYPEDMPKAFTLRLNCARIAR